jgi:hypothetical protein
LVPSKLPKKFRKIKKKNCQSFYTLFRERAVFLWTTSRLSCTCQFLWLHLFWFFFRENYKKNSEKIKKVLFLLVPFGKIREKFRKKGKFMLFACSVRSFHPPLFSPCCATSRHVLASSCDLYFGSGLNNR